MPSFLLSGVPRFTGARNPWENLHHASHQGGCSTQRAVSRALRSGMGAELSSQHISHDPFLRTLLSFLNLVRKTWRKNRAHATPCYRSRIRSMDARSVRQGIWELCLCVHVFIRSPQVHCRVFIHSDQRGKPLGTCPALLSTSDVIKRRRGS